MVPLELQIIRECRFGKVSCANISGVMKTLPPANKVQQVVSPGTQGSVRQPADILVIEVAIDPANLLTSFLLDHTNRALCGVGNLRANHTIIQDSMRMQL